MSGERRRNLRAYASRNRDRDAWTALLLGSMVFSELLQLGSMHPSTPIGKRVSWIVDSLHMLERLVIARSPQGDAAISSRLLRGVYPRAAQSADPWARNDSIEIHEELLTQALAEDRPQGLTHEIALVAKPSRQRHSAV
jgi:hypothetical protein